MTHAMVISGVHVDDKTGRPVRFKVENSWGDDSGHKGFLVMSEKWFDECVFHVVVCPVGADVTPVQVRLPGRRAQVGSTQGPRQGVRVG